MIEVLSWNEAFRRWIRVAGGRKKVWLALGTGPEQVHAWCHGVYPHPRTRKKIEVISGGIVSWQLAREGDDHRGESSHPQRKDDLASGS